MSNAKEDLVIAKHGDNQRKMMVKAESFLDFDHAIRLYNKDGKHVMSIVRCLSDGGFDVATPSGKVLWADCDGEMIDFWEFLSSNFHAEKI